MHVISLRFDLFYKLFWGELPSVKVQTREIVYVHITRSLFFAKEMHWYMKRILNCFLREKLFNDISNVTAFTQLPK